MSAAERCEQVMHMIDQTLADYEREAAAGPPPRRRLPAFGVSATGQEPATPR